MTPSTLVLAAEKRRVAVSPVDKEDSLHWLRYDGKSVGGGGKVSKGKWAKVGVLCGAKTTQPTTRGQGTYGVSQET